MSSFTVSAFFPGEIFRLIEDIAPKKLSIRALAGVVLSSEVILPFALLLGILLMILILISGLSDNAFLFN